MNITSGTARVDNVEGVQVLSVPWAIKEGETLLTEAVQSFELGTPVEEIKAFLERTLEVFQQDTATHEASKALQEKLDATGEIINEVSNITI